MFKTFLFDLKAARKQAGLTQFDCAHLLGASNNIVSRIEIGQRMPTIRELLTLSLIYGQQFESFYAEMLKRIRRELSAKLTSIPDAPSGWALAQTRVNTLKAIWRRLRREVWH